MKLTIWTYKMKYIERRISVDEYLKLRSSVGWRDTATEKTKIALKNSIYSIVVEENKSVIGMGRIVGDGGIYYYIQGVIVIPEKQKMGIGTKIMGHLMKYIQQVAEPGSFIALTSAEGRSQFYKRFGFSERESDAPGMYFIMK